ncbi:MAG: cupin domain-containing protein [Verrucomicrobiota bacterium]
MKISSALLFSLVLSLTSLAPQSLAAEGAYARETKITQLIKTQVDGAGKPIVYPSGTAEVTGVLVEIPPGAQTNWHKHPVPAFAYMLEGELRVDLETGVSKTFKAGDVIAEVVNLLHNGVVMGQKPVKLVMFALSTAGQPYAVKAERAPTKK